MNRGDVVKAELPRPRGQQSHEQYGYRRAVILQNTIQSANPPTLVVVPTTSNLRAAHYGESFILRKSPANGLDCDSVLLVNQIRALDTRRISEVVGHLAEDDMGRLENAVRKLLSL